MSGETVTLSIDGREITVPKGTLIIRAAEQLGTIIPRFCDHPLLDPVGACRQCIVEIGGQRKPMMACTTPVADEMQVSTHLTSEVARAGQEGTLELLLINHPLDCPMCDKGGECPLQDQALAHGANVSRFVDEKRRYLKPVAISPQVLLDRERCVLCARCTRFSEQISGDPFIELFERGALEQVAIYEDEPYESYFSGNVIQICPVGALTSTSYRFKARPFDVTTTPSVCDHCSAGCNLTVQARGGKIQRQLARTNMDVNEAWTCDRGRFGFAHLTAQARITAPRVREDSELVDVSWSAALNRAAGALRDAGPDRVAVVAGARLPDEDAYALGKYARTVLGTDDVDSRPGHRGVLDRDELVAALGRDTATYADVERAPVILTVGLDPVEEVPILHLRLRKAWRDHKARLVPVGPRMGSMAPYAWRRLTSAAGGETAALASLTDRVGDTDDDDDVAAALRDVDAPVILVGERAPAGALANAAALAETVGGKVAFVPRRAGARGALEAGLVAGLLPGGRRLDDAEDRDAVRAVWGRLPERAGRDLTAILEAAAAGEIDVLHLVGVDLARDCPSQALARRALDAVDTVITQDLAATDTTAFADIVLPATATQERSGSYTDWEGRTQGFQRAIDGPGLALDDLEILIQLTALLGQDLGFDDLDGLRAERDRLGTRATPHAWPDLETTSPGDDDRDAFTLLTYPLLLDDATMLAGADDLLASAPAPAVALNVEDAARVGVVEGQTIEVSANGTSLRLPARLETDVVPGTVFVPASSTETTGWQLADTDEPVRVVAVEAGDGHAGGAESQAHVGQADGGVSDEHARRASEGGDR